MIMTTAFTLLVSFGAILVQAGKVDYVLQNVACADPKKITKDECHNVQAEALGVASAIVNNKAVTNKNVYPVNCFVNTIYDLTKGHDFISAQTIYWNDATDGLTSATKRNTSSSKTFPHEYTYLCANPVYDEYLMLFNLVDQDENGVIKTRDISKLKLFLKPQTFSKVLYAFSSSIRAINLDRTQFTREIQNQNLFPSTFKKELALFNEKLLELFDVVADDDDFITKNRLSKLGFDDMECSSKYVKTSADLNFNFMAFQHCILTPEFQKSLNSIAMEHKLQRVFMIGL